MNDNISLSSIQHPGCSWVTIRGMHGKKNGAFDSGLFDDGGGMWREIIGQDLSLTWLAMAHGSCSNAETMAALQLRLQTSKHPAAARENLDGKQSAARLDAPLGKGIYICVFI